MRIRYKAFAIPELEKNELIYFDPKDKQNEWNRIFKNENPIHLEIGSGRGSFITKLAEKKPNINFIALEMEANVFVYAARLFSESKLNNIRGIRGFAEYLAENFGENEISKIYINFPNPWPKRKQHKKRLTHINQLKIYKKILKNGGEIEFKTDDLDFFNDSLKYFEKENFKIIEKSYDLKLDDKKDNIVTEYEAKWRSLEVPIKYAKIKLERE